MELTAIIKITNITNIHITKIVVISIAAITARLFIIPSKHPRPLFIFWSLILPLDKNFAAFIMVERHGGGIILRSSILTG